jgi:hypothetical protein
MQANLNGFLTSMIDNQQCSVEKLALSISPIISELKMHEKMQNWKRLFHPPPKLTMQFKA